MDMDLFVDMQNLDNQRQGARQIIHVGSAKIAQIMQTADLRVVISTLH